MDRAQRYVVNVGGRELGVEVTPLADGRLRVSMEGATEPSDVTLFGDAREPLAVVGRNVLELHANGAEVTVGAERRPVRVESRERRELARAATASAASGTVRAPMPGRVVKVLVEPGATVEKGAGVVVVEAMKMENELFATISGVVERVAVRAGDAVERGATLVEIR